MTRHPLVFSTLSEGLFFEQFLHPHIDNFILVWQIHLWQTGKPEATCRSAPRRYAVSFLYWRTISIGQKVISAIAGLLFPGQNPLFHTPSDNVCGSNALWWGRLRWTLSKIMILLPEKGSPKKGECITSVWERTGGGFYGVRKTGAILFENQRNVCYTFK